MLRAKINESLKEAMRQKDERGVATIRLIIAEMKKRDIDARPSGNTEGIGDADIASMMQTMIKQRRESIVLYEKGNRPDLAAQEAGEITVIERFLPKQMTAEETDAAIAAVMTAIGANSIKDMGKVMAELKQRHAGQMDFSQAGPMVKAKLGG